VCSKVLLFFALVRRCRELRRAGQQFGLFMAGDLREFQFGWVSAAWALEEVRAASERLELEL